MPANPLHFARSALLASLVCLVLAAPAAAQYVVFPRVGLSGAPDHYEPVVEVHGQDPFDIYVIVLPPEGQALMQNEYASFNWAVLEACCGGAANIVSEVYNPACEHVGSAYGGVTTTVDECVSGAALLLCTLTVQMDTDIPGTYWVVGGPLGLSYDCVGEGVLMTDMIINVIYTNDTTPVEASTWSDVKELFQ